MGAGLPHAPGTLPVPAPGSLSCPKGRNGPTTSATLTCPSIPAPRDGGTGCCPGGECLPLISAREVRIFATALCLGTHSSFHDASLTSPENIWQLGPFNMLWLACPPYASHSQVSGLGDCPIGFLKERGTIDSPFCRHLSGALEISEFLIQKSALGPSLVSTSPKPWRTRKGSRLVGTEMSPWLW